MENARVGQIMIPLGELPQIPYWFTLRQAMAEMDRTWMSHGQHQKYHPWLLLVFNAQNQLLGYVGHQEIMKGLKPALMSDQSVHGEKNFSVKADPNLLKMSFNVDKAQVELREQIERTVVEFMLPIDATVEFDDYVLQAVSFMIDKRMGVIPVVRDNIVVGVLFALDVLGEITRAVI